MPGFAMVKIKGYFWIHFGGFEVVALLVSVSTAHVKVMKVNCVTQDYINEIYIFLYNYIVPSPLVLYSSGSLW